MEYKSSGVFFSNVCERQRYEPLLKDELDYMAAECPPSCFLAVKSYRPWLEGATGCSWEEAKVRRRADTRGMMRAARCSSRRVHDAARSCSMQVCQVQRGVDGTFDLQLAYMNTARTDSAEGGTDAAGGDAAGGGAGVVGGDAAGGGAAATGGGADVAAGEEEDEDERGGGDGEDVVAFLQPVKVLDAAVQRQRFKSQLRLQPTRGPLRVELCASAVSTSTTAAPSLTASNVFWAPHRPCGAPILKGKDGKDLSLISFIEGAAKVAATSSDGLRPRWVYVSTK